MNITIKKFSDELDKSCERIQQEVIRKARSRLHPMLIPSDDVELDKITQRKHVKRIINVPEYKWESHGEIFLSFDELSPMLEESSLSVPEKAEVIFYLLRKNLATKIADQEVEGFDYKRLSEYPFKTMTFEEVKDFLCTEKYRNAKETEGKNLTAEEQAKFKELEKAINEYSLDLSPVAEQHKLIKKHYFDKHGQLSKEDIEIVIGVLKDYKLSDTIANELIGYLTIQSQPYMKYFMEEIGGLADQVFSLYKEGLSSLFDPKKANSVTKLFLAASLHAWLNNPVEAAMSKTVFGGFNYLEKFIGKRFKERYYTQTLLYIAARNIEFGILEEEKRSTSISLDQVSGSLLRPSSLPRFRDTFDKFYRNSTLTKTDEKGVRGVTSYDIDDFLHLQYCHQLLKEHYFDKIDSFTEDDIFKVCIGLGKAGVSLRYLALVEKDLRAELNKRRELESAQTVQETVEEQEEISEQPIEENVDNKKESENKTKPLSRKATNEIYREMQTYFDFNEMKSIRYLSLDEIIYCMSLMKKVNIPDERIRNFIKKAEKANRTYQVNPVTRYIELLKKLEFYSDNEKIMRLLTELKEAYASITPEENDPFYEEYIASGLNEILGLIPDTHEYEFNASLELLNKVD